MEQLFLSSDFLGFERTIGDMEKRTFTYIEAANKIWVENYVIASVEASDTEFLLITGDRGYPDHFRIEIKFLGPQYIACATWFEGEVCWRMASEEEVISVHRTYAENDNTNVYCIEENFAVITPQPSRKPRKFFIAAGSVEVTVFFGGKDIDEILKEK